MGIAAIVGWLRRLLSAKRQAGIASKAEAAVDKLVAVEHAGQLARAEERGKVEAEKEQKVREVEKALQSPSPEDALAFILNDKDGGG